MNRPIDRWIARQRELEEHLARLSREDASDSAEIRQARTGSSNRAIPDEQTGAAEDKREETAGIRLDVWQGSWSLGSGSVFIWAFFTGHSVLALFSGVLNIFILMALGEVEDRARARTQWRPIKRAWCWGGGVRGAKVAAASSLLTFG
jgi:hypothetical protein